MVAQQVPKNQGDNILAQKGKKKVPLQVQKKEEVKIRNKNPMRLGGLVAGYGKGKSPLIKKKKRVKPMANIALGPGRSQPTPLIGLKKSPLPRPPPPPPAAAAIPTQSHRSAGSMRRLDSSSSNGRYSNPCLTMHQPWASLLVHGIKRVEGRSWPSPITGRLWIHAASKVPDPDTIRAMEDFYREIYAVNGITDIKFPDHYPVSRLLGCVQVVGCVRSQELVCWEHVPESVRLEGLTDFCWLCEDPQRLVVPFEMRGYQGVYNLERRIFDGAVRGLSPVQGPQPVKFPLPDPRDPFSLKPGSLTFDPFKSAAQKTASVTAAIAGARAAATQFSRKDHNAATSSQTQQFSGNHVDSNSGYGSLSSIAQGSPSYLQNQNQPSFSQDSRSSIAQGSPSYLQNQNQPSISKDSRSSIAQGSPSYLQIQNQPSISQDSRSSIAQGSPSYLQDQNQLSISQSTPAYSRNPNTEPRRSPRLQNGAPNRLVAVALRELKLSSDSQREGQSSVPRSWPRQNS